MGSVRLLNACVELVPVGMLCFVKRHITQFFCFFEIIATLYQAQQHVGKSHCTQLLYEPFSFFRRPSFWQCCGCFSHNREIVAGSPARSA